MARPALLDEILPLSPTERLRLDEDIWDSVDASTTDVPVPAWHRDELDHRLADPTEQAIVNADDLNACLL